jgi:hypothetical protein
MNVATYPVSLCYAAVITILCQKIVVFNSSTDILLQFHPQPGPIFAIQQGTWSLFAV